MSPLGTFLRGGVLRPNAAPELRITLARRLVETPGAPFVSTGEVFTEAASARDELGLLPATQGPTVVRVQVEGGTSEQGALAGDWLVDPDGGDRIAQLPHPRWDHSGEAAEWFRARSWLEAWETCQDARWMLDATRGFGVEWKLLVLAACACARTALHLVPSGEARPLQAIEAAERWARGEATREEVQTAARAGWDAYETSHDDAAYAAYAAAYVVVCHDAARTYATATAGVYATAAAASAHVAHVAHAAHATANALVNAAARTAALARCAELVRREIPTLVVLRAVATPVALVGPLWSLSDLCAVSPDFEWRQALEREAVSLGIDVFGEWRDSNETLVARISSARFQRGLASPEGPLVGSTFEEFIVLRHRLCVDGFL